MSASALLRPRLQRRRPRAARLAQGLAVTGTARHRRRRAAASVRSARGRLVFDGMAPATALTMRIGQATHVAGLDRRRTPMAIPCSSTTAATSRQRRACAGSATSRRSASMATSSGAWVDEETPAATGQSRAAGRGSQAEQAWLALGHRSGASVAGLPARRHLRPGPQRHRQLQRGHGAAHRQAGPGVQPHPRRGHRQVLEAAIARPRAGAVYNVADDEPAPPQDVIAYAARAARSCRRRRIRRSRTPSCRPWRAASMRNASAPTTRA